MSNGSQKVLALEKFNEITLQWNIVDCEEELVKELLIGEFGG